MTEHYATHVEDTDDLISVAGPRLGENEWWENYKQLMDEQAKRKYGFYLPTSEGGFPSIPGVIARYSAKGLTNEQMSNNPVWKDLTGNGHDLQMKNFAWAGMSGVGGYKYNFKDSNFTLWGPSINDDLESYKLTITKVTSQANLRYSQSSFKSQFKITGLSKAIENNEVRYFSYWNQDAGVNTQISITSDGIYDINVSFESGVIYFRAYGVSGTAESPTILQSPIIIEQLPTYPDSIVFDGVDDYGVCDNLPILTKESGYTVVALRHLTDNTGVLVSKRATTPERGAFVVDKNTMNRMYSYSFGLATTVDINRNNAFVYQTSKSYMGQKLALGGAVDIPVMVVGAGLFDYNDDAVSNMREYTNCSIHELVILDHDATEEELNKIKEYYMKQYPWLFFDQAWTVNGKTNDDEDRATIKNLTGNGNDLVLSNFAFAGNSGYGSYPIAFPSTLTEGQPFGILHFTTSTPYSNTMKYVSDSFRVKFELSGLDTSNPNNQFIIRIIKNSETIDIVRYKENGVYEYYVEDLEENSAVVFYNGIGGSEYLSDFYVRIIPEYEGYLVTDGVDDKVVSSNFVADNDFTIITDYGFIGSSSINSTPGFIKHNAFLDYCNNGKHQAFIKKNSGGHVFDAQILKSILSNGKVYADNWEEIKLTPGNETNNNSPLYIGGVTAYTQMYFKFAAFYPTVLSKEDCIKAYNYLQTLKEK